MRYLLVLLLLGCGGPVKEKPPTLGAPPVCEVGNKLRVHFYDVAQALAVLVDLPDGRHLLIDTGDEANRPDCGRTCADANARLLAALAADLGQDPIAMLWITHQHSDHVGGAPSLLEKFHVQSYVDNGRDLDKDEIKRAHSAAVAHQAAVSFIGPGHTQLPVTTGGALKLTALVPVEWPKACTRKSHPDANQCSIGLRIDYCSSSVLFTGDGGVAEEAAFAAAGPVTLLQVGHHGSETSSAEAFIAAVKPRYAVISAGKRDEGMNAGYCHPRQEVVARLSKRLGGATPGRFIESFHGATCKPGGSEWDKVGASDALWATEVDGDIVLETSGDGVFARR